MKRPSQDSVAAVLAGLCPDPRGVLGPLTSEGDRRVRVFLPPARGVEIRPSGGEAGAWTSLERIHEEGMFEGPAPGGDYRLRVRWESGDVGEIEDPYRFDPGLREEELEDFRGGSETRLAALLGPRVETRDGVQGTRFAVWAPRAEAVNLMGSFNGWEGRRNPMRPVGGSGVWELFMPGVGHGALYKYEIRASSVDTGEGPEPVDPPAAIEKADPLGRRMELRPSTASVVTAPSDYAWSDADWMSSRAERTAPGRPVSIYEVHLGSWRRTEAGEWLDYRELARRLLPYVKDLGFTHVELLPLTEHPHDASWGYQTVGYFALTSRYGEADDFRWFVDEAHRLEIGVLLDWAPAHFPRDAHGLWRFDGRALYEHPDPRRGHHPDWDTAIFDYGRPEVVSFLVSSARHWVDEFHIDGLRVDAVASMLYRDYSREEGEWEPNPEGGRENLEAVAFVKRLAESLHEACPGALLCAEESTAWPGVTAPVSDGGLGFDFKWNMGWMNDSLAFLAADPLARAGMHERLTFSLAYAHAERYLLPLSHDEVVHMKGSLFSRMPGSDASRFAGLRLLLGYQWTHPGGKLLFMGGEVAQPGEWDESAELPWDVAEREPNRGVARWVRALNRLYRSNPALHAMDHSPDGFDWLDVHDADRNVLSYLRWAPEWDDFVVVVANFAGKAWAAYPLAVPAEGQYEIVLDGDAAEFGGKGRTRTDGTAGGPPLHGRPASLEIDLPPLTVVLLRRRERGASGNA